MCANRLQWIKHDSMVDTFKLFIAAIWERFQVVENGGLFSHFCHLVDILMAYRKSVYIIGYCVDSLLLWKLAI